jgi:molecular chaperone DnaK (HSP70)
MSISFRSSSNIVNLDSVKYKREFEDFFNKDLQNIYGSVRRLKDDRVYASDIESVILVKDSSKMSFGDLEKLSHDLDAFKSKIVIVFQNPTGVNTIGRIFGSFKTYFDFV